jgi:hypothetical protein
MSISNNGLINWTPASSQLGNHSVNIRVSDGTDTTNRSFTLTVAQAPVVQSVDVSNLNSKNKSFTINWVSPGSDSVQLSQEFNGTWGAATTITSGSAKNYSNKSAGRYRFRVSGCSNGSCGPTFTSAAFTVSTISNGTAVSQTVSLSGLSNNVGFTAGQFNVSESGAATYSIPLTLPDGVAGVKPQMSFNYSSQGGDGRTGTLANTWS